MSSSLGHRQSPIDLEEDNCLDAKGLPPLAVKYTPCAGLPLENTGFSWKVLGKKMLRKKNSSISWKKSFLVLCIVITYYYMCLANYGASEAVNLFSMYVQKSAKYSEQKCASYFRE